MRKPKLNKRYVCKCHLCQRTVIYPLCWRCQQEVEEGEQGSIRRREQGGKKSMPAFRLPTFRGFTVDMRQHEFRKLERRKCPETHPFESDTGSRLFADWVREKPEQFLQTVQHYAIVGEGEYLKAEWITLAALIEEKVEWVKVAAFIEEKVWPEKRKAR